MTTAIRLRHISIKDYKGIDHLELDFPVPDLPGDPDVIVIGSENGLGKTSVLECCAFVLLRPKFVTTQTKPYSLSEYLNLLIRAGASQAEIIGKLHDDTQIVLRIGRNKVFFEGTDGTGGFFCPSSVPVRRSRTNVSQRDTIGNILGHSSDPVIENELVFFHSYRKIHEGNLQAKALFKNVTTNALSNIFKRTAMFLMMSNAGLFDSPQNPDDAQKTLDKLDNLLSQYAGCRFAKLRPTENDNLEFRVQPTGGGDSFNFDALSSGQKEIITTLFLIWYETRNQSKVVLIDEPELHLNSQWHRSFVNSLIELAPQNQYIIATHSATIMDSVNRNRRILLQNDKETVQ